ncbi:uncharacterized protein E0L32_002463 [Thyridium curvatum]|uniref:DUF7143 domain-containing protein n=1 Tax=Thyridium curvatum TaxID=1093900 RepID=A0A507BGX1_9PEZI|nr:uncharacterized protein E0L32_002463 [Thyridium curvatum]TPX18606.1 hypothetical protein E0L32_002463 [Thyridium curvatum]
MKTSVILAALACAGTGLAAPAVAERQAAKPCFVIGSTTLPKEVSAAGAALANTVTCSRTAKTLSGVPDVTAGTTSFSAIDFSKSKQSTLAFALDKFATASPLAGNDLKKFQNELDVYVATEVGIRSVGGNLAIKVPKFFLEFQVSRIRVAQGDTPKEPGLQVDHLRDKVLKNAANQDKALLDQVRQLATVLA